MQGETLLIFPPVWLPEAPFLSTAALVAYLQQHGVKAQQWDLNLDFWEHFEQPEEIADVHRRSRALLAELVERYRLSSGPAPPEHLALVAELPVERFEIEVRSGIIPRDTYRELVKLASRFSIAPAALSAGDASGYHDLLYSNISLSHLAGSSADLAQCVAEEDPEVNPFAEYFTSQARERLLAVRPALLGLSIAATNQVVPAFTLARLAKEWLPACHVVIGGSWCTHVRSALAAALPGFPYIDSLVIFEGEEPLRLLAATVLAGGALDEIPNHYWNRAGGVSPPPNRWSATLDQLPTPVFSGLPVERYDFSRTVPLQASRGCYWARCTFCSYPALEPVYKSRNPEALIEDVLRLKSELLIENIGFTDALLSPSFARRFSQGLLDSGIDVRWTMFARFEKAFSADLLALMARSGCSLVSWGLESGCPQVLDIIDKSIDLDAARRILADAARLGIHNRVLVMYGHPTETLAQATMTVSFLEESLLDIHSISHNFYHPELGTPIERFAPRLGINLVREPGHDLALGYRWSSSLTATEQRQVRHGFERISNRLEARVQSLGEDFAHLDLDQSFSVRLPDRHRGEQELVSAIVKGPAGSMRRLFEVKGY